jgi:hypothetical protein
VDRIPGRAMEDIVPTSRPGSGLGLVRAFSLRSVDLQALISVCNQLNTPSTAKPFLLPFLANF